MPTFNVPRLTASSIAPAWAALNASTAVTPTSSFDRNFFIINSPSPTYFKVLAYGRLDAKSQ